jgi:hypothetical protein
VLLSAAVLSQKSDQVRSLSPIHRMVDKPTRAPCAEETGARQRIEVVGECGPRRFEPALDFVDAITLRSSPHE